jgi:hypothetical protein
MITSVRVTSGREAVLRVPGFALALGAAEAWFRFGSFALECLAFLGVWGVLDALTTTVLARIMRPADLPRR